MPVASTRSPNLSVANATHFVDSIENGSRILYSFLGGASTAPSSNLNHQSQQNDLFKSASFFKRLPSTNASVLVENIKWNNRQHFDTWTSEEVPTGNYYVTNPDTGYVYLVVQNDDLNRIQERKLGISPSIIPTHTYGYKSYSDGYSYLYLFTIDAIKRALITNDRWIPVPNITIAGSEGRLTFVACNVESLRNIQITGIPNPEIPILSGTGTEARIILVTTPLSSPLTRNVDKQYKIVGVKIAGEGSNQQRGTISYDEFNLKGSLEAVLTNESSDTITAIQNAITLGFSPVAGFNAREVLQATNVVVVAEMDTDQIKKVTTQTQFYQSGIVEGISKYGEDETELFPVNSSSYVLNNIKVTIGAGPGFSTAPSAPIFTTAGEITSPSTSNASNADIVSTTQTSGSALDVEVQHANRKVYNIDDAFGLSTDTNNQYKVTAVTHPNIPRTGTTLLHKGKTSFSITDTDTTNKKYISHAMLRF